MSEQQLHVGHRRIRITPPVGTFLMGYASRTEPSEGVHDNLYANAVALSDGDQRIVLVTLDVCSLEVSRAVGCRRPSPSAPGWPLRRRS